MDNHARSTRNASPKGLAFPRVLLTTERCRGTSPDKGESTASYGRSGRGRQVADVGYPVGVNLGPRAARDAAKVAAPDLRCAAVAVGVIADSPGSCIKRRAPA